MGNSTPCRPDGPFPRVLGDWPRKADRSPPSALHRSGGSFFCRMAYRSFDMSSLSSHPALLRLKPTSHVSTHMRWSILFPLAPCLRKTVHPPLPFPQRFSLLPDRPHCRKKNRHPFSLKSPQQCQTSSQLSRCADNGSLASQPPPLSCRRDRHPAPLHPRKSMHHSRSTRSGNHPSLCRPDPALSSNPCLQKSSMPPHRGRPDPLLSQAPSLLPLLWIDRNGLARHSAALQTRFPAIGARTQYFPSRRNFSQRQLPFSRLLGRRKNP